MITSLSLAFLASRAPRSSVMEGKAKTQQEAPIEAGTQTNIPWDAGTEKQ